MAVPGKKRHSTQLLAVTAAGAVTWLVFLAIVAPQPTHRDVVQKFGHDRRDGGGHERPVALGSLYDELRERDNATTTTSSCPDVVALTYASHGGRDDRFCRSLESAIRNGVDLRVLGWGVPWEGLSQKLGAALAAVKALDGECVVMFVDAYDVLFADSLDSVRTKFDAIPKPLVFSGECGCWPHVQRDKGVTCRDRYPTSPTPYRYLNSGSWIGRADVASKFLQRLVDDANAVTSKAFHKLNDQELAAELYFSGVFKDSLTLDHYASLFLPMHAVRDRTAVPDCDPWPVLRETDGVWRNSLTNPRPSVFHFNGGGKIHHLPMEKRMWWKQCREAFSELNRTVQTRLLFHDRLRSFDDVCPNHISPNPNARVCGSHISRLLDDNLRRIERHVTQYSPLRL